MIFLLSTRCLIELWNKLYIFVILLRYYYLFIYINIFLYIYPLKFQGLLYIYGVQNQPIWINQLLQK